MGFGGSLICRRSNVKGRKSLELLTFDLRLSDLRLLSRGNLRSTRRGDPTFIQQAENSPADGDDAG